MALHRNRRDGSTIRIWVGSEDRRAFGHKVDLPVPLVVAHLAATIQAGSPGGDLADSVEAARNILRLSFMAWEE